MPNIVALACPTTGSPRDNKIEQAIESKGFDLLTVKRLLYPLLAHPRAAHVLKYIVYGSLVINLALYARLDYLAMQSALPDNASLEDILTQFSTTVDMIAWVGLVFLFELETYSIPDEKWTAWIGATIRSLRIICYIMIGGAAYGYTVETLENYDFAEITGLSSICDIAGTGSSMQTNVMDYVEITADNCDDLSDGDKFFHIANEVSVIDEPTLEHVQWQGWVDVDNAFVWLIVVFLIEAEVWLQARDRFSSPVLHAVRQAKSFFYLVLIANMFIWLFTGYRLYAWDAFLWIFGFWAIELNLAEWELERTKELEAT